MESRAPKLTPEERIEARPKYERAKAQNPERKESAPLRGKNGGTSVQPHQMVFSNPGSELLAICPADFRPLTNLDDPTLK